MSKLKKAFFWIVKSSEDSKRISLTVKGILSGLAVYVLSLFLPFFSTAEVDVNLTIDQIVIIVENLLIAISALTAVWGAVRKIRNTWF